MESLSLSLKIALLSLPLVVLCYRFVWCRYARPTRRGHLPLVAILSLGLGGTPGVLAWQALEFGQVLCRRCSGGYFLVAESPAAYWLHVALLVMAAVLGLSGLLFAVDRFLRWHWLHPNNSSKPTPLRGAA